jgi:hypothetical protein
LNYEACNNGKIDEVKYLLPKSNLDVKNEKGETSLISGNNPKKLIINNKHLFFDKATKFGQIDVIGLLLEKIKQRNCIILSLKEFVL